jgi:hypothetical protein
LIGNDPGIHHASQVTLSVVMSCIAAAIFSCLASTSFLMIGLRLVRLAAVRRALASRSWFQPLSMYSF